MNLKAGHFRKERCPAFSGINKGVIKRKMKITRCKYGHYYDKAYFRECPHCCRKRGGRDEDIIIKNVEQTVDLLSKNRLSGATQNEIQDKAYSTKEKDRASVERWIGEAWDELEEILNENYDKDEAAQKDYGVDSREEDNRRKPGIKKESNIENRKEDKKENKKENKKAEIPDRISKQQEEEPIEKRGKAGSGTQEILKKEREKECERDYQEQECYMIFSAMPLKVIKNQEFCMDFCLFPEDEWETGAKMLHFKSQESIRDLKPVQLTLPTDAILHVLYKDEEIFQKKLKIGEGNKKVFCTFPVTVTDTRDRRFHMIKVIFEVKEQNIEIPLYLVPNP